MDRKILEETGLTAKEADVYLALLSLRSASVSEVMGKAGVSRKSVYEILQKLLEKGLTSYTIVNNKKKFNASDPNRLIELLEEKKETLQNILPEFLAKYREKRKRQEVEVFTGKEGLKALSNNILNVRKPVYILANEGKLFEVLKEYMSQFMMKRLDLQIMSYAIYSESVRDVPHLPLREVRYVPKECANSPLSVAIYGDHVNMLIFSETPLGIHIQSEDVAQSFMNYFDVMWAIGKK